MKKLIIVGIIGLSVVSLAGCHSSNTTTSPTQNPLTAFSAQTNDSQPKAIDNAISLQNDINALFGNANGDPVEVEPGDTIADVIHRASGI